MIPTSVEPNSCAIRLISCAVLAGSFNFTGSGVPPPLARGKSASSGGPEVGRGETAPIAFDQAVASRNWSPYFS